MIQPALNVDEIIGIARQAKSLMQREELAWLCELARLAPDGTGLEVGVYCGASLIAWSLMRQGRGMAIGVDDWSYRDIPNLKEKAEANLNAAKVSPLPLLIDATSEEAAKVVTGLLAFCFIDGNHTQGYVDRDIEWWTPKIMPGGIVAFHDYARRKDGCYVKDAVDAWLLKSRWPEVGLVTTLHSFRRPA